ncbi:uncharacterized protein LOC143483177 [Brachyhypopomus gauderio]|uniref:uncharacterized protein LOC143483177 n=1 Tax=Brachyhypopomus gauderio TaxID=698409 RepID=UPI004042559F
MVVIKFVIALSILVSIPVSSEVFRLVGSSVQLDIQRHGFNDDDLSWMFNEHNTVKSDSGLYKASASDEDMAWTVAEYTLSVLDPVETPVLTAVPDHLSTDPDPCNITLTCRGHDLSVNSSCYNETCEEKEVTSPGGVTLFLFVRDSSSIICNISNPASWNMSVMEMNNLKVLCHHKDAVSPPSGVSVCLLKTVLYSVVLILMVSAVITVHIKEKLAQQSM